MFGLAGVAALVTSSCQPKANWQTFNAAGLKLDVPATPEDTHTPIPEAIASVTDDFKLWQCHGDDCEIAISHGAYKQPANLQGAAEGAISGIKSKLADLKVKDTSPVTVSGHEGIEAHVTYSAAGNNLDGSIFTFTDGPKLWQVQVLSTKGSSEKVAARVKASMKFE